MLFDFAQYLFIDPFSKTGNSILIICLAYAVAEQVIIECVLDQNAALLLKMVQQSVLTLLGYNEKKQAKNQQR